MDQRELIITRMPNQSSSSLWGDCSVALGLIMIDEEGIIRALLRVQCTPLRITERSTYFLATAAHLHNCSSKNTQTVSLEDRATVAVRHFSCPLHGIVRFQQDRVRKHLITKHGRIRPQVIC